MAKTKISEYDVTAGNNTDINSINIDEGCSPSGINNSIRAMMSHLKGFQSGSSGENLTVGGNLYVTGTSTLSGDVSAPTQASSDNSTKVATTAYVHNKTSVLGTMSTQNASAVAITGGTLTGVTVNFSNVGTNAAGARTISTSAPTGGSSGDIWYQVSA